MPRRFPLNLTAEEMGDVVAAIDGAPADAQQRHRQLVLRNRIARRLGTPERSVKGANDAA